MLEEGMAVVLKDTYVAIMSESTNYGVTLKIGGDWELSLETVYGWIWVQFNPRPGIGSRITRAGGGGGGRICPPANSAPIKARITIFYGR